MDTESKADQDATKVSGHLQRGVITLPESIDAIEDVELFKSFNNCRKKPIIIQATQMSEDFRVETLEGNYKQGKKGGYLMCGIDGELYICDESIFKRTYDWL